MGLQPQPFALNQPHPRALKSLQFASPARTFLVSRQHWGASACSLCTLTLHAYSPLSNPKEPKFRLQNYSYNTFPILSPILVRNTSISSFFAQIVHDKKTEDNAPQHLRQWDFMTVVFCGLALSFVQCFGIFTVGICPARSTCLSTVP